MDQDRAIFFIDARNILGGQSEYQRNGNPNYQFGYKEIVDYMNQKRNYKVIRGYYYDGAAHPSQRTVDKERFFDHLRKLGITLRLKEIDFTKPGASQKGVDICLTSDMISLAYENAYDVAVLLSGDGDYVALVELVKAKGKRVVVLAFKNSIARSLKECADNVIYFEDTPELTRQNPVAAVATPTKITPVIPVTPVQTSTPRVAAPQPLPQRGVSSSSIKP